MSERLTDEQLRAIEKDHEGVWPPDMRAMAAELLATRSKLAMIGNVLNEWKNNPVVRLITAQIAIIR